MCFEVVLGSANARLAVSEGGRCTAAVVALGIPLIYRLQPHMWPGNTRLQGRRERLNRPKRVYRGTKGRGSQMHTRCLWSSAPDRQLTVSSTVVLRETVTLTPRVPLSLLGASDWTGRQDERLSHTHICVLTLLSTLTTLHIYKPTRSKRRKLWGWLSCGCPCGIHGGIIQDMCTFWDLAYTLLNLRRSPRHST